jgi:hypothetical protein
MDANTDPRSVSLIMVLSFSAGFMAAAETASRRE